jgi:hypothetical protein
LFVNSATRKKIPLASASGQGFMVNNKKLSRRYIRAGYSAMGNVMGALSHLRIVEIGSAAATRRPCSPKPA